ncbi:hypothetical protein ADK41_19190 [Streptomyces caelestis]|uniref:Uncharacterized protein n=1 Tax=Streptomyces caelestis TaxID=36816 RepID=A0A0M9X8A1_9ACTN|nr:MULTISPECIES: hypothetical protein [Streptomyces]KOT37496.1 hypothetical protein ADK41_19190 [Streptomyces caelestis]
MRIELALKLLGPHAGMDAQDSLQTLTTMLALLRELEATETARPGVQGTRWTFNELRLGSVTCVLEPLRIAEHSTYDVVERVARNAVGGLYEAESTARIPTGWTLKAAGLGRRVAKSLGASPDVGMILEVRGDGEALRTAEITQRAALHLDEATRTRHRTFGSRRGRLSGLQEGGRQRRLRGVLRTEVGGEVIPVYFGDDLDPELRRAWRRDRVEITGEITENAQGQSMWMRARDIELLATSPQLSDDDLRGGFWPDMTSGQDAVEYVEALRGDN